MRLLKNRITTLQQKLSLNEVPKAILIMETDDNKFRVMETYTNGRNIHNKYSIVNKIEDYEVNEKFCGKVVIITGANELED